MIVWCLDLAKKLEGDLDVDLEGYLVGWNWRGAERGLQRGLHTGLGQGLVVKLRSCQDQVWSSLKIKFNA